MKRRPIQVDVSHLEAMRDNALSEARKYQDALDVIYGVAKLAKKAEKITSRVQARAASEEAPPKATGHGGNRGGHRGETRTFLQAHANWESTPFAEGRRLAALPSAQQLGLTAKALESGFRRERTRLEAQRKAELKQRGDRAIDRVRRLFASTNGTPLTREEVGQRAKLAEISNPKFVNQSAAKVLESLVRAREVRKVRGGFVAWKLQTAAQ